MPDKRISELDPLPQPSRPGDMVEVQRGGGNFKCPTDSLTPYPAGHQMRPPWSRKIGSDWRANTAASGTPTAASLRAQPFTWVDGLTINGLDYYVQGSVTSGQVLHVGIYDVDPLTNMPTDLLWASSVTLTTAGNKSFVVDPAITGRRTVWVASYLTTGTTQFATGAASGMAHLQMGLASGAATNVALVSLLSNGTWGGSMPATFPYATDGSAATSGGAVPQFNLTLAAP